MYVVKIVNKENPREKTPVIFTGSDSEYKTLTDGIDAAKDWIAKSENPSLYELNYRIVGCL